MFVSAMWIWVFFLKSHLAVMDFSGISSVKSNSVRLGSISVPWRVQRAKIILALGGFSSAFDVSAVVFKSLWNLQKVCLKDIWNYVP